jgi:hypothetical protein
MEKNIKINGLDIIYDIEALVNKVNQLEWDEENFKHSQDVNEYGGDEGFTSNEAEFNRYKTEFIEKIMNLDTDINQLIYDNIILTKSGKLAKNRKQVIIQSDIMHHYEYFDSRSHGYESPYIKAVQYDDNTVHLEYNYGICSQGL